MPAYSRILLPWDSQPQEPVGVDLNNPLMRGVVEVYVPPWMGGGTLIASPVRTEAGTIERTTRAIGRGRVMNSSSYDSWADAGLSAAFTQQLTWFALLDIDSHTAGSFILGNVEAASTGYNHGLYINNSKFPTFFVKTGGVGASAIGSAVITAVGPIAMVGTYDGATMVVHSHTYSTGLYQRATTAKTGNLDTTTFPVTVGRWNGGFGGMAGTFYVGGVVRGVWTDQHVREFFSNPWQIFAPRSIWVPVSQAAAGGSTITAAAGAATTSTLTGSSTAASTIAQADGAATASSIAGSSIAAASFVQSDGAASASTMGGSAVAAAAITQADGAATASSLAGSSTAAAAFTQADGTGTGETLVGDGLTAGDSSITPAAGVATTSTMVGSAIAAASITQADGAATASSLAGASVAAAAFTAAEGAASASTFAASAVAASVCIAAAGAAAEQTLAGASTAAAAITAAAGVATCATLADADAVDTNSAWWTYTIPADNLTFAVAADDLTYTVSADSLRYDIDATTLAGA